MILQGRKQKIYVNKITGKNFSNIIQIKNDRRYENVTLNAHGIRRHFNISHK